MKQILIPVLFSAFLGPGAGQLYNKNYKKGFLLLTVVLLGIVGVFAAFVLIAREEILKITDETLLAPGLETVLAQKIMREHPLPLMLSKWGFVVIWCYSVVDAYVVASRKKSGAVTVAQMQEIDKRSEKEFGISSLRLMENAGKAVADFIQGTIPVQGPSPVVIFCGKGNNGGDGMAAARHLHAANIPVEVFYIESQNKPPKFEVKTQLEKLKETGMEPTALKDEKGDSPLLGTVPFFKASLIVDALLGTGSQGEPAGLTKTLIDEINKAKKSVLSIDIPSGLNADTGEASTSCIKAQWTVTLGLAKVGLLKEQAKPYVGKLTVTGIGHPKKLLS